METKKNGSKLSTSPETVSVRKGPNWLINKFCRIRSDNSLNILFNNFCLIKTLPLFSAMTHLTWLNAKKCSKSLTLTQLIVSRWIKWMFLDCRKRLESTGNQVKPYKAQIFESSGCETRGYYCCKLQWSRLIDRYINTRALKVGVFQNYHHHSYTLCCFVKTQLFFSVNKILLDFRSLRISAVL